MNQVIERSDLFYAREIEDGNLNEELEGGQPAVTIANDVQQQDYKNKSDDSDDEEIGESGFNEEKSCHFVVCGEHDKDAVLYANLNLPGTGGEKVSRRVDGTCALCLDEYQEGDTVLWSDSECSHVFHKECLVSRDIFCLS